MISAAPRGIPGGQVRVLADVRAYDHDSVGLYDSSFSTIKKQGTSSYARVIGATPGLAHWWRMGSLDKMVFENGLAVVRPSAGSACLMPAGDVTVVAGLIPGDRDGACYLNTAYMHCNDYFIQNGTHEVFSMECWYKPIAHPTSDSALMGEWYGSTGNMLFIGAAGVVKMFQTSSHADSPSGTLQIGRAHHVVGCFGGTDHVSRLYVNGVQVASGNLTNSADSWAKSTQFEVGQYARHTGTNMMNGVMDEIAIYSRMLQPVEVKQHFDAAFVRFPNFDMEQPTF